MVNTADELEFRFVSGHRALDLVSTLGNRHRQSVERLRKPADLDRWLGAAGLALETRATARDLAEARRLRESVNRIMRAVLASATPAPEDVAELNAWARRPPLAPQTSDRLERRWVGERPVRAALALIAREAAELVTSDERTLVRECAATPSCSLLYLDRSRGRRRRWCEMDRCGSRAKMAGYRHRRATASSPK